MNAAGIRVIPANYLYGEQRKRRKMEKIDDGTDILYVARWIAFARAVGAMCLLRFLRGKEMRMKGLQFGTWVGGGGGQRCLCALFRRIDLCCGEIVGFGCLGGIF